MRNASKRRSSLKKKQGFCDISLVRFFIKHHRRGDLRSEKRSLLLKVTFRKCMMRSFCSAYTSSLYLEFQSFTYFDRSDAII